MKEGRKIITFLGQSGSGKTTQIGELLKIPEFRQLRSVTTRSPRASDLPREYKYLTVQDYRQLQRAPGRLLWDVITGNGDHYGTDVCDIVEALTDKDHSYINSVIPRCARWLVDRYGSGMVKTILLPSPGDDVLMERMIKRGNSIESAVERLANERQEGWHEQAIGIKGLYVVCGTSIVERNQEILQHIESDR